MIAFRCASELGKRRDVKRHGEGAGSSYPPSTLAETRADLVLIKVRTRALRKLLARGSENIGEHCLP